MRLLLQHRTHYGYDRPAALGPHIIRLRPAAHTRARVETYALRVEQEHTLKWQQDPYGNHVARVTFRSGARVPALDVLVEMAVDVRPVNPFDFFVDDRCIKLPFEYPQELRFDLQPFLDREDPALASGRRVAALLDELPRGGETVPFLVAANSAVSRALRYVIREEPGIWTPEETLEQGRGSCRDSAVLLIALLRARGLAARFVSGYLVQLTDEGMIPDAPKGVLRDVVDLHAWVEVFLPGAGWVGLDATSGLLAGEGHIPLACTASPALAAPIEGTSDVVATDTRFAMAVGRLGHEPRPTAPYAEETWDALVAAGDALDARLAEHGITLTVGGEPTFNAREHAAEPEWNGAALGPTKARLGRALAHELKARFAPGGVVQHGMGKQYPGEPLPRWALHVLGRRDGRPLVRPGRGLGAPATLEAARRLALVIAERVGARDCLLAAYEDPWRVLTDEAQLPVGTDPHAVDLKDPEARRRLARVLDRGVATEVGFALPLLRRGDEWASERWTFRRERLYLVPGDSPMGLRLPLSSLEGGAWAPGWLEEPFSPPDPRRDAPDEGQARTQAALAPPRARGVRTALCVEPRGGDLFVFVPPVATADDFLALLSLVDEARWELGLDVELEGYPPPPSPSLVRLSVTPDPGVLEVNIPPAASCREHAEVTERVFDAALHAGLCSEKYLVDGRQAGSGGGHHITLGGPSPLASPFVRRPDLLASLLTFLQHHPSLSYMFTGLFVGPTSQAPRVDEARHEALYELEIAMEKAFDPGDAPPPWLSDMLFRHLLVDVTGNTHRAEVSLDKLFDPQTAHGRQGLLELRAFEMPPHPRLVAAQATLARALVAAFAKEPYQRPLVRWGQMLHDRFLLPYWMWRDFEDALAELHRRGVPLPADAYRPFLELRCPLVGALQAGDVRLEIRNAIEPWHVLGEELVATGTARFVDSSMERIEVLADGLVPERYTVLVNGRAMPMRPTATADRYVAGVRFRAWAPPHSLHAHIGIHHPIRLDVIDTWASRSLGACAYHVWHPEGRAFEAPPLTRFEAAARRAQRFTQEGPLPWPVRPASAKAAGDAPYTLDLRRFPMDRPMPRPTEEE